MFYSIGELLNSSKILSVSPDRYSLLNVYQYYILHLSRGTPTSAAGTSNSPNIATFTTPLPLDCMADATLRFSLFERTPCPLPFVVAMYSSSRCFLSSPRPHPPQPARAAPPRTPPPRPQPTPRRPRAAPSAAVHDCF